MNLRIGMILLNFYLFWGSAYCYLSCLGGCQVLSFEPGIPTLVFFYSVDTLLKETKAISWCRQRGKREEEHGRNNIFQWSRIPRNYQARSHSFAWWVFLGKIVWRHAQSITSKHKQKPGRYSVPPHQATFYADMLTRVDVCGHECWALLQGWQAGSLDFHRGSQKACLVHCLTGLTSPWCQPLPLRIRCWRSGGLDPGKESKPSISLNQY